MHTYGNMCTLYLQYCICYLIRYTSNKLTSAFKNKLEMLSKFYLKGCDKGFSLNIFLQQISCEILIGIYTFAFFSCVSHVTPL